MLTEQGLFHVEHSTGGNSRLDTCRTAPGNLPEATEHDLAPPATTPVHGPQVRKLPARLRSPKPSRPGPGDAAGGLRTRMPSASF
jgi:hypothetical protein